jgi:hypothetical protein
MTPQGVLMSKAVFTSTLVILDYRQKQSTARLEKTCSKQIRRLHGILTAGVPICTEVQNNHDHDETTKVMNSLTPADESLVMAIILHIHTMATIAAKSWAGEK